MADKRKTFVIVHGAWAGGWAWKRVIDRLHALGHKAYAPTLTGLGERKHLAGPDVTLDTHIDDIVNEVLYKDLTDITLVTHSYGGIVGTGVAERIADRISAIVFVDAIILEDETSFADVMPYWDFTEPLIASPPSSPGDYLREEDRLWVDQKATPQPTGTFTQKLRLTGAYERIPKKTYILATGWDGFGKTADKYRDAPGWTVREIATGHDVAIDAPDELVGMLVEA
ncbi:MAG: Salicylate esterase [Rhizobium sp.]|nr:Salicylate esterase [Rhizobium sp.]